MLVRIALLARTLSGCAVLTTPLGLDPVGLLALARRTGAADPPPAPRPPARRRTLLGVRAATRPPVPTAPDRSRRSPIPVHPLEQLAVVADPTRRVRGQEPRTSCQPAHGPVGRGCWSARRAAARRARRGAAAARASSTASPPESVPIRRSRRSEDSPSRSSSAVARSSTSQSSPTASRSAGSPEPPSSLPQSSEGLRDAEKVVDLTVPVEGEVLRQVADLPGDLDRATGRRENAGREAQERRLARPVHADEAGMPRRDEQVHAVEDGVAVGPGEADTGEGEDAGNGRRHRSLPGCRERSPGSSARPGGWSRSDVRTRLETRPRRPRTHPI